MSSPLAIIISIVDKLDQHAGFIQVISSFVVALATAIYVFITWRLLEHYKKKDALKVKPKLLLNTIFDNLGAPVLVISNVGLGPANRIQFQTLEDGMDVLGEQDDTTHYTYLDYLAPGHNKQYPGLYPQSKPCYSVDIDIEFYDVLDNKYTLREQVYTVDPETLQ